jgi:hypothetical protein
MKYNKKYVFILFTFIVGLICGLVISQNFIKDNTLHLESIGNNQSKTNDVANTFDKSFPWLDFPMEYFKKEDVQWGSVKDKSDDEISDYKIAAIKNIAVYQSYPVTSTTIQSYSSEVFPLKLLSAGETQAQIAKMEMGSYRAEESFKKFGVLTSHYLPAYSIYAVDKFDVDGDGQDESIVSYTQTDAAGFGAPMTDIIKGNNIIFTLSETGSTVNSILPAETTNGFYAEWGSVGEFTGRCCEEGLKRTRFVFKDGKFTPLFEQEIRYLKVGKE